MQMLHPFSWRMIALTAGSALAISGTVWAQDSGSVNQAFQTARKAVSPEKQKRVVSVYGQGSPTTIQKWYIIFYDPTVLSRGRAVLVENNQISKTYAANGGVTYSSDLTFDPSRITSEGPALSAAQGYAAQHNLAYDSVTVLFKQTSVKKPFLWRVGLIQEGKKEGYVLVNAQDDTVVAFAPPTTGKSSDSSSSGSDGEGFGDEVKKTFLGIGGDLQEFFTGERTVDK